MANSKPPSHGWVVEDDPFIEVYNEIRTILHYLGMKFPNRHRFDCFRLYTKIWKLKEKLQSEPYSELSETLVETYDNLLYLIDEMVHMKINGMEPAHLNGKYI